MRSYIVGDMLLDGEVLYISLQILWVVANCHPPVRTLNERGGGGGL